MLAAFLEARAGGAQRVAAAAGMAHQFGAARRDRGQQLHQFGGAEAAGDLEAGEVVGGAAAVALQHAVEAAAQQAERVAGQPLEARHGAAQRVQREIEGAPHPADPELLGQARHRVQHRRRQVGVLVGIEVGGPDAGVEDAAHLRASSS